MISHVIDNSTSRLHTAENTSLYFDELSGYIYAAYIDNNLLPMIARAHISNLSNWLIVTINSTPVYNDAHVGIIVTLDPFGYIHVMWGVHNSTTFDSYKRSTLPHDLTTLVWAAVDVTILPSRTSPTNQPEISYPRLYRAGDQLYLTFRNGTPGNADQYLLTWDNQLNRWTDSPGLIISSSQSSPYLGVCRGFADGSLHLIWTSRIGYYNQGLYYAKWDGQSFDSYQVLPLSCSLSNTGLSVLVDGFAVFLFYLVVSETGHPEVYCSTSNDLVNWTHSQVTDLSLTRLRGCPAGPVDGPYRPCDMELQGPWTGLRPDLPNHPQLFFGRSVALPGPLWQRPSTILYSSTSYDDGLTWTTRELPLPVHQLTTELTINNSSQILDFALCQDIEGNMRLLDFRDSSENEPELSISTLLTQDCVNRPLYRIDNPSIFYTRQDFTIDLTIRPDQSSVPTGLIDIGGPVGSRAFRILLWGNGRPLTYSPSHLQILLGDESGSNWSLIWNPEIEVKPLTYSHLRVERYGSALNVLKLTSSGWVVVASTQLTTSPLSAVNRYAVIGGIEDAYGMLIESFNYKGFISVEITQEQIPSL